MGASESSPSGSESSDDEFKPPSLGHPFRNSDVSERLLSVPDTPIHNEEETASIELINLPPDPPPEYALAAVDPSWSGDASSMIHSVQQSSNSKSLHLTNPFKKTASITSNGNLIEHTENNINLNKTMATTKYAAQPAPLSSIYSSSSPAKVIPKSNSQLYYSKIEPASGVRQQSLTNSDKVYSDNNLSNSEKKRKKNMKKQQNNYSLSSYSYIDELLVSEPYSIDGNKKSNNQSSAAKKPTENSLRSHAKSKLMKKSGGSGETISDDEYAGPINEENVKPLNFNEGELNYSAPYKRLNNDPESFQKQDHSNDLAESRKKRSEGLINLHSGFAMSGIDVSRQGSPLADRLFRDLSPLEMERRRIEEKRRRDEKWRREMSDRRHAVGLDDPFAAEEEVIEDGYPLMKKEEIHENMKNAIKHGREENLIQNEKTLRYRQFERLQKHLTPPEDILKPGISDPYIDQIETWMNDSAKRTYLPHEIWRLLEENEKTVVEEQMGKEGFEINKETGAVRIPPEKASAAAQMVRALSTQRAMNDEVSLRLDSPSKFASNQRLVNELIGMAKFEWQGELKLREMTKKQLHELAQTFEVVEYKKEFARRVNALRLEREGKQEEIKKAQEDAYKARKQSIELRAMLIQEEELVEKARQQAIKALEGEDDPDDEHSLTSKFVFLNMKTKDMFDAIHRQKERHPYIPPDSWEGLIYKQHKLPHKGWKLRRLVVTHGLILWLRAKWMFDPPAALDNGSKGWNGRGEVFRDGMVIRGRFDLREPGVYINFNDRGNSFSVVFAACPRTFAFKASDHKQYATLKSTLQEHCEWANLWASIFRREVSAFYSIRLKKFWKHNLIGVAKSLLESTEKEVKPDRNLDPLDHYRVSKMKQEDQPSSIKKKQEIVSSTSRKNVQVGNSYLGGNINQDEDEEDEEDDEDEEDEEDDEDEEDEDEEDEEDEDEEEEKEKRFSFNTNKNNINKNNPNKSKNTKNNDKDRVNIEDVKDRWKWYSNLPDGSGHYGLLDPAMGDGHMTSWDLAGDGLRSHPFDKARKHQEEKNIFFQNALPTADKRALVSLADRVDLVQKAMRGDPNANVRLRHETAVGELRVKWSKARLDLAYELKRERLWRQETNRMACYTAEGMKAAFKQFSIDKKKESPLFDR